WSRLISPISRIPAHRAGWSAPCLDRRYDAPSTPKGDHDAASQEEPPQREGRDLAPQGRSPAGPRLARRAGGDDRQGVEQAGEAAGLHRAGALDPYPDRGRDLLPGVPRSGPEEGRHEALLRGARGAPRGGHGPARDQGDRRGVRPVRGQGQGPQGPGGTPRGRGRDRDVPARPQADDPRRAAPAGWRDGPAQGVDGARAGGPAGRARRGLACSTGSGASRWGCSSGTRPSSAGAKHRPPGRAPLRRRTARSRATRADTIRSTRARPRPHRTASSPTPGTPTKVDEGARYPARSPPSTAATSPWTMAWSWWCLRPSAWTRTSSAWEPASPPATRTKAAPAW